MTEQTPPPITFDAAPAPEAGPRTAACAACGREISGEYYTVNGHVTCASCRAAIADHGAGTAGARGLLTAIALGSAAGLAGAIVWWAIRRYASLEVGLIAIAIGHFVGLAVRRGSGGRGGRGFQVLAVALTYFWITANYVPDIVQGMLEQEETTQIGAATSGDAATGDGVAASTAAPAGSTGTPASLSLGGFLLGIAFLFGIAMAAPFLQGAGNIIGVLIISFGLWQAWKLNARTELAVDGPFRLDAAAPPASPAGA